MRNLLLMLTLSMITIAFSPMAHAAVTLPEAGPVNCVVDAPVWPCAQDCQDTDPRCGAVCEVASCIPDPTACASVALGIGGACVQVTVYEQAVGNGYYTYYAQSSHNAPTPFTGTLDYKSGAGITTSAACASSGLYWCYNTLLDGAYLGHKCPSAHATTNELLFDAQSADASLC